MFSNFIMLNLVPIRKGIIILLGTCDFMGKYHLPGYFPAYWTRTLANSTFSSQIEKNPAPPATILKGAQS